MPYKNIKDRMKRQQERRDTPIIDTPIIDTPIIDTLTHEHPMMKYLVPGEKREDMEAIVLSLKKFNVLDKVDLGFVPMTIVADYLEATAKR